MSAGISIPITGEELGKFIRRMVYRQGKAKICNMLEMIFDEGNRLDAFKKMTENILDNINDDICEKLQPIFEHWNGSITVFPHNCNCCYCNKYEFPQQQCKDGVTEENCIDPSYNIGYIKEKFIY